ncbi:unnamed protein product [Cylicocyclus nassatus]|uniref:F-box domain-containing protein n=1 Tax=Cylicocyclus nassatus TaxID=53992 RepID=A0AA36GE37_CYLNA|nr:unnamed protein product [Cylicocyclus nassatus]
MLSNKLRRLFAKLNVDKDMKIQSISKRKLQTKKKPTVELPDNVWNLIFDYSSPFDVIKWRRVNKQFKRITDSRVKRTLYLDVLRMDITQILPKGVMGDGDFFRHPTCNLLGHHEYRSLLLVAHAQWTAKEAAKLLRAVQFFGKNAHTIMTPGWLQGEAKFNMSTYLSQSDGDLPQWNPTTQRIPLGPLFPKAREITFRCTVPQLRRMRRLAVYRVPATMIFSPEHLQVFRLAIIGGRSNAPATIKLRPFREWLDADQLGNKLCVQFC